MNRYDKLRIKDEIKDTNMKPLKYSKSKIKELFERYSNITYTQIGYCCKGLNQCCYCDEFVSYDYEMDFGRVNAIKELNSFSKYLYNTNKYGKRIFIDCEDMNIFVYARDILGYDFYVGFWNN